MPTNSLAPKTKNYLSSIPPKMSERFGSAVLPYLQSVQGLFPPTNPYGQATSNFLLGQAPQAAQRMAEGYPNVLFDTRNPLGGNRIVNPAALDMAVALPIGTALKGAGLLAKGAPLVGGITTWHGSPHKFEPTSLNDLGEFNAAKIGTGEGAQAYGHGLYLAENPGVAKQYAKELGGRVPTIEISGQIITPPKGSIAEQALTLASGVTGANAANPLAGVADKVAKYGKQMQNGDAILQQVQEWQRLGAKVGSSNNLYKVDIPDEQIARMLDWDKPLSEQPGLNNIFTKLANSSEFGQYTAKPDGPFFGHYYLKHPTSPYLNKPIGPGKNPIDALSKLTGQRFYDLFADLTAIGGAKDASASAALRQAGIPGVRYLDAGSRGAGGQNTSNFVVFPGNEHMMTILERNGQAMSPESQAIARYREVKGPKSVVRMEAALRTAGVPLPKNEPVAYIQRLVDQAHRRN